MAFVLAPALLGPRVARTAYRIRRRADDVKRPAPLLFADPGRLAWWSGATALTASVLLPINEIFRIAVLGVGSETEGRGGAGLSAGTAAFVATVVFLPLHVRHVGSGLQGRRPRGDRWTLAVMALAVAAPFPVIGATWCTALSPLAVSVLVLYRPPTSVVVTGLLVVAPLPLAALLGDPGLGPYYAEAVALRTAVVFALVWLVGAVTRLEVARRALADDAVDRERGRIAAQLNAALGAAVEEIAATGRRLGPLAQSDPAAARAGLADLVGLSRRTLAETRRLVVEFRRVSFGAELEAVASLLLAAGVEPRVDVLVDRLPERLEDAERRRLHAAVGDLISNERVRAGRLTVVERAGRVQVDVVEEPLAGPRPDRGRAAS